MTRFGCRGAMAHLKRKRYLKRKKRPSKILLAAAIMISSVFNICFLTALASSVAALGPAAVNLRTAGNYAILSQSGISTVPPSVITGNIGVSPIAATGLTGFSLTVDSTGEFATSSQVVGEVFAASYSPPTPVTLTTAIADMVTAFNDATGRVDPNFVNLGAGAIGSLILLPGLYTWDTGVTIGSDIIIAGLFTDTWIFQIAGTLSLAANVEVILVLGALSSNIVWVVTDAVTVNAGAHLEGVVLGQTSISLLTGATANSRLLAQTDVVLQKATVTN
ncbi:ice-binding protein [Mycena galericulata]|nr:ice-binding protein [Mycena galericulata]